MVQGKFKKGKVPASIQKKQKQKNASAFTRRANAPIQSKKGKLTETQKIKQVLSKTVNKSMETELRSRAAEGRINLSKAQQAVAKHHKKDQSQPSTSGEATSTST